MSWLFGINNKDSSFRFSSKEVYSEYETDSFFIAVGGNSKTSCLIQNEDKTIAYVGVLLKENNDGSKIIPNKSNLDDLPPPPKKCLVIMS